MYNFITFATKSDFVNTFHLLKFSLKVDKLHIVDVIYVNK